MSEQPSAENDRTCDWCGQPAPEGAALLSIWWADYECCSMGCAMLAEGEPVQTHVLPPAEPNPYGPGAAWKWLACCEQQSIDGHLPSCNLRVLPPGETR